MLYFSLFNCVLIGITTADVITKDVASGYNFDIPHDLVSGNNFDDRDQMALRARRNSDMPEVKLFYECMCPGCRRFDSTYFAQLVTKLGAHLDIHTYPYGKASTTVHYNGTVDFACQHGPAECYGNALHACAQASVRDRDQALLFNACLMDLKRSENGSNDNSLDECGEKMSIDVEAIKDCAKGDKGVQLLQQVGEESVKAHYTSLPHLLINGRLWTGAHEDLIKDVCAAFKNPPEDCKNVKPIKA